MMQASSLHPLLLILGALCLFACASEPEALEPDEWPYRLEKVRELEENLQVIDLDGDGRDELVLRNWGDDPVGDNFVRLMTQDERVIEQVNFSARLDHPLYFLDVDRDGTLEILVPYLQNDSLFVSFVGADGRKLFRLFLATGEPRHEEEGIIPWDPQVHSAFATDVDGDDRPELVTVLFTGYARLPRGVFVHRLPDGQLLGQKIIGAGPFQSFLGNFDEDEQPEVFVRTGAPNNGAVAGGFDDRHAYLIAFDLAPTPTVTWSKEMGPLWTSPYLAYHDFDGDGRREFLAFSYSRSSRPQEARLELIEPGTWRTVRQRTIAEPFSSPVVLDLDRDATPEILAIRSPGDVWVFDEHFEIVRRRHVAVEVSWLSMMPDVDGDGIDEVVALTPHDKTLLLDPRLEVKAVVPGTIVSMMHRGLGLAPYLLVHQDDHLIAMDLSENPRYLFNRYGPLVLWILGLGLLVGVAAVLVRQRRRNRLLERLHALTMESADAGLLVLDPRGRITWINNAFLSRLSLDRSAPLSGQRYDEALEAWPPLVSFVDDLRAMRPPLHHADALTLPLNGQDDTVHVVAEPFMARRDGRAHWLIRLEDPRRETMDPKQAHAWKMMAQRIAHDLKSPLTAIQLMLQRLQIEYREQTPAQAEAFDEYSQPILELTGRLRQMTRNFLKFVDLDQPALAETDLNGFIREHRDHLRRELPSDIELHCALQERLPVVRIDHEQFLSVLENLIVNALNAMPEGGRITVATQLAQRLQLASDTAPRDYVALEVMDTGVGIPASMQARLFEPGFTTKAGGTGLGLTFVKKIVDDHGGHIEVASTPGAGSSFTVYLPA